MNAEQKEFILSDGRKVQYYLGDSIDRRNGKVHYVGQVKVYEKHRRLLTLGLTKTWSLVEMEEDRRINRNKEDVKERMKELREIALGEKARPLEKMLDDVLGEIEPNHNT